MIKNLQLALVFFVLIFFPACEKETPEILVSLNDKLNFDASEYHEYLKTIIEFSDSSLYPEIEFLDTLKQFYQSRNFNPIFIRSFEEQEFVNSFIRILSQSDKHGLNPQDYHYLRIKEDFDKAALDSSAVNRYEYLVNTELYTADAVLKYSYHMRYGKVDPKVLFPDSYFLPSVDSLQRKLFHPFYQEDVISYLQENAPQSIRYKNLQTVLERFYKLGDQDWRPVKITKRKIVPGEKDTSIIDISEKLIILGFLDTAKFHISDFTIYDSIIVSSVKRFQQMHGLNQDGVIGATTVARLNLTPGDYINKIKLSLERLRWFDYSDKQEYILVNIPDFNLYVIENGHEKFRSKVCTGRKRSSYYESQYEIYKKNKSWRSKPEDWETPLTAGEISYMVLNPTWTVPVNIIREEIAGGIRKDSLYLQKKDFKVFQNGREVAAAQIKPHELSSANIPYTIVQSPGYLNALGKIKFMFNNPFGIYLHDTPTKSAFNLDNRAVSHGCVRVEKPLALSEFLLNHQKKWNIDYLKAEIGSPVEDKSILREYWGKRNELRRGTSYGKTTEVKLDRKVNLFIDYYTAWVDNEGNINFRDDVYKKDEKLMQAMGLSK